MSTLGGMDLTEAELGKLFASFDTDSSGFITIKELTTRLKTEVPIEQLMNALAAPGVQARMNMLFRTKWDINGDGSLDMEEFGLAVTDLGVKIDDPKALKSLFMMLDEDGGGSISLKELNNSLRWVRSCDKCQALRSEAYTFNGTLSIVT